MFGLVRSLISLAVLAAFLVFGFTVPLGKRTLFEHIGRIWKADETQELVDDVKESSKPMVERVTRGVKAGVREATSDGDGGTPEDGATDDEPKVEEKKVEEKKDNSEKPDKDSRLKTLQQKAKARAQAAAQREVENAARNRVKREAERLAGGK